MFKKLSLGFFAAFLCTYLALGVAHAQTDAAPFAGKCFGDGTSTCLVPELSFNVGRIRLNGPDAGKMQAGAIPVGAGYALLFGFDKWWAAGPSVHAIVDFSQSDSTFFQLAGMVTAFRYVHAGVVWARTGNETQWYAAAGLALPIGVLTTEIQDQKAKAVRAARATRAE